MESGGKSVTKRHRKKWVDALSLVLPVLLFFAVLNCFTTYLYYQDYQCKMDILTEVAAGAETTGCLLYTSASENIPDRRHQQEGYQKCWTDGAILYARPS